MKILIYNTEYLLAINIQLQIKEELKALNALSSSLSYL